MNERKIRVLRALSQRPRSLVEFTGGDLNFGAHPNVLQNYLNSLVEDGYAEALPGNKYGITNDGAALLAQPVALTPSRIYTNAATSEPYQPPVWNPVRPGADAHKAFLSRGV